MTDTSQIKNFFRQSLFYTIHAMVFCIIYATGNGCKVKSTDIISNGPLTESEVRAMDSIRYHFRTYSAYNHEKGEERNGDTTIKYFTILIKDTFPTQLPQLYDAIAPGCSFLFYKLLTPKERKNYNTITVKFIRDSASGTAWSAYEYPTTMLDELVSNTSKLDNVVQCLVNHDLINLSRISNYSLFKDVNAESFRHAWSTNDSLGGNIKFYYVQSVTSAYNEIRYDGFVIREKNDNQFLYDLIIKISAVNTERYLLGIHIGSEALILH